MVTGALGLGDSPIELGRPGHTPLGVRRTLHAVDQLGCEREAVLFGVRQRVFSDLSELPTHV
jgi:hypothetical protein